MDIKSVKEWRSDPLTCVSGHPAEVIDWLVAEVERLTAQAQDAERRTYRYGEEAKDLEEERDKYKTALEGIAEHLKLPCDKRDDGVLEQIAAEAVRL